MALAQHHDFHSALKLFLTVIKYSARRSHIVSKGPLKILKEVLDVPSGKPKGQNGKEEPQKNGKGADLGVTERAGGQGGGAVNVSDYRISHEERHHAHHKCQGESDNRAHVRTHTLTRWCSLILSGELIGTDTLITVRTQFHVFRAYVIQIGLQII